MQLFSTQMQTNLNYLYFDVIKVKLIMIYKTLFNISWQNIIYFCILISFIIHFENIVRVFIAFNDWFTCTVKLL